MNTIVRHRVGTNRGAGTETEWVTAFKGDELMNRSSNSTPWSDGLTKACYWSPIGPRSTMIDALGSW